MYTEIVTEEDSKQLDDGSGNSLATRDVLAVTFLVFSRFVTI